MAALRKEVDPKDKPYVDNYPPLRDWLRQIGARCNWQLPLGNAKEPVAYVEQWQAPGSAAFIVVVHARGHGWNIFTACGDNSIAATLIDAAGRIGLGVTNAADLAAVLETQQVAQGLANGLPPRGELGGAALARRAAKPQRVTVTYLDPDGLPRAFGRATTEEAADKEAKRQLAMYREKKAALGDPLATAEYMRKVIAE